VRKGKERVLDGRSFLPILPIRRLKCLAGVERPQFVSDQYVLQMQAFEKNQLTLKVGFRGIS
jgi:hypothetical protein